VLLAHSDELGAWMHSHFKEAGKSELDSLRKELADLKKEDKPLRSELETC
jgi:hypothetical protein